MRSALSITRRLVLKRKRFHVWIHHFYFYIPIVRNGRNILSEKPKSPPRAHNY